MRRAIYAVYDRTAQAICTGLFTETHNAVAIRNFADTITQPNCPFAKHPDDYTLVCLGVIEPNGQIKQETVEIIISARAMLDALAARDTAQHNLELKLEGKGN